MTPKKIGDTSPGISHESGAITVAETVTKSIVMRGMYAALEALLPKKGGKHDTGDEKDWWVSNAHLEPGPGGTAKLTLSLTDTQETESEEGEEGEEEVTYEIEWSRIEKPIQVNPIITSGYEGDDLQKGIDELEAWRNSPQQRRRRYEIPKTDLNREPNADDSNDWQALSALAKKLAVKIAAGIESYLVFSPVISRTSKTSQRPTTGGCGKIQTPANAIGGYVYLKVADSAVQQADGSWRRVQQWQGADKWDTDLYATGS